MGKNKEIKELGESLIGTSDCSDRIVCIITTDIATYDANTHLSAGQTEREITEIAKYNVRTYQRHVVKAVPIQGVGNVDVAVTFIPYKSTSE